MGWGPAARLLLRALFAPPSLSITNYRLSCPSPCPGSPITVHGARLAVKQEDDVHCTYQRISYSAVFHRAKGLTTRVLERLRRGWLGQGMWAVW